MNKKEIQTNQQKMIRKMKIKQRSQHTIKKYNTAFNNLNTFLETYNINTINNETIDDIIIEYQYYLQNDTAHQKLSNNTINQYLILIKKFLTKECKITTDEIEPLTVQKEIPKYIDIEQYQEIQNHLEKQLLLQKTKHWQKIIKTDQTIINLLFNTGLRIHEALKITINEIIKIKDTKEYDLYDLDVFGKGKKKRTIHIPSNTYDALMQYVQECSMPGSKYIFESIKAPGNPVTTMTIERHFKRIAKELDAINDTDADDKNSYQNLLKPHNLRHSFAVVKTAEKRMPINALKEVLGHENITTTQIYTKLNTKEVKKAFAKTI